MNLRSGKRWSGLSAVVVSALLFGTLPLFGKYAQRDHLTIVTLLGLRFLIATTVLWAVVVMARQAAWPGARCAVQLAALGLLFVGQSAAYFISLTTTPAAVTAVLLYIYPVVVTAVGWIVFGEKVTSRTAAALALATLGVILVIGVTAGGRFNLGGILWGIAAGFLYAGYIVVGKRTLDDLTPLFSMAAITATAACVLVVYGTLTGSLRGFDAAGWAPILGAGLLPTVIGATLFLFGLARVGATRAAVLSTLEPVATGVLAAILLAEGLPATRILGGAAVLLAAVLVVSGPLTRRTGVLAEH
ncbi:MAG: DMT family transporter [Candidatus Dormibacteria bacterium]